MLQIIIIYVYCSPVFIQYYLEAPEKCFLLFLTFLFLCVCLLANPQQAFFPCHLRINCSISNHISEFKRRHLFFFFNAVKDSPLQCFSSQCDVPSPVLDPFLLPVVQFSSACQLQTQKTLNLKQVLHPCPLLLSNQLCDSHIDALARTEPLDWVISKSTVDVLLFCFSVLAENGQQPPMSWCHLWHCKGLLGVSEDSAQVSWHCLAKI